MDMFDSFWIKLVSYNLETPYNLIALRAAFDEANGCGAKDGIKFSGCFYGVSIVVACKLHDIEWSLAKSYEDLIKSNYRFRRNMERIIDYDSANKFMVYFRMRKMNKYYAAIKLIGTNAYAKQKRFLSYDDTIRSFFDRDTNTDI